MLRLFVILVSCLSTGGVCCANEQALKAVLSDSAGQLVGFAVWHTDNIVSPGQPPTPAVQADIQVPDLGMTVRLDLRRNAGKSLLANHILQLAFTLPAGFLHGGIANVPGILLKDSETARGRPLNGVSMKIGDNLFLIGLTNDGTENIQRNLQLMREGTWIDVPIVYSDGKRAILAVEKGDARTP